MSGIVQEAAFMRRIVQYCQHIPSKNILDLSIKTKWLNNLYSEGHHLSPKNQNPTQKPIERLILTNDVFFQDLKISNEFFQSYRSNTSKLEYFIPESSHFSITIDDYVFVYLESGWFYYSRHSGIRKKYESYLNQRYLPIMINSNDVLTYLFDYLLHQMFYPQVSKSPLDKIFHDCSPGDIRIRYEFFPPHKISIVGKIKNKTIVPFNYYNRTIGRISFENLSFFDLVKTSKVHHVLLLRFVKLITSFIFIGGVCAFTRKQIQIPAVLVFSGSIIFLLRSFLWHSRFLQVKIWISITSFVVYFCFKHHKLLV